MKLSFVVQAPERDKGFEEFEKKLKTLKELGYHGAELAIKDPLSVRIQKVKEIVINSGLAVSAIDTGIGYIQNGPALNNTDELIRNVAVGRIKEYIKIASMLKSNVTIGTVRGLFGDDPEILKARKECFVRSLKECNLWALKHGVVLLLEPLSRVEMDFINSTNEAIEFLLTNKLHDIKIFLDTFHMDEEYNFINLNIARASVVNLLGNIHVADVDRFKEVFEILEKLDYKGFLTVGRVYLAPYELLK